MPLGRALSRSALSERIVDLASGRGELDGVFDQVPQSLLKSDRVGVDVVAVGTQVDGKLKLGIAQDRRGRDR